MEMMIKIGGTAEGRENAAKNEKREREKKKKKKKKKKKSRGRGRW